MKWYVLALAMRRIVFSLLALSLAACNRTEKNDDFESALGAQVCTHHDGRTRALKGYIPLNTQADP